MKCLYNGFCTLENTDECNQYCIRYSEMKYMLDKSMIPEKKQRVQTLTPQECDKKAFEFLTCFMKDIKKLVDKGTNLVIYSTQTGNGKTSWAVKMLLSYFDKCWCGNGFKPRGYFIYVPDFLNRIKASISHPDESLTDIMNTIKEVDLVVFDDIGTCSMSEYDMSILTSIIDQRVLNEKSTIYTTNCGASTLKSIIGARLFDRVWNTSKVVELTGNSNRGRI